MLGLAADLASKAWAFQGIQLDRQMLLRNPDWHPPPDEPVALMPWRLLDLNRVINRGAVFGIGTNQRFFFITFTLGALVVGLVVFGRMTTRRHPLAHIAIAFILAGGVGTLYDRIVFSVVRDFLHMLPGRPLPFDWRWPGGSPELFPWVFNVADMLLLLGMILLMIHMSRLEKSRKAAAQPATTSPESVSV